MARSCARGEGKGEGGSLGAQHVCAGQLAFQHRGGPLGHDRIEREGVGERSADPFADEGKPGDPPAKSDVPPLPAPVVKNTGAAPTDDPPPAAEPSEGGGIVERMPASAYPEPYTRGLFGSSLWLTMHGQQWPYYPRTGIGISGYAWVDNAYAKTRIGDVGQPPHLTRYIQQGRAVLRVTPTYSQRRTGSCRRRSSWSATRTRRRPSRLAAAADTDDMWVRAGVWKKFDITVGRFEAFEVYHLGMGLDLNTVERIGAVDSQGPGRRAADLRRDLPVLPPERAREHRGPRLPRQLPARRAAGQWGNDTVYNTWASARRSSSTSAG